MSCHVKIIFSLHSKGYVYLFLFLFQIKICLFIYTIIILIFNLLVFMHAKHVDIVNHKKPYLQAFFAESITFILSRCVMRHVGDNLYNINVMLFVKKTTLYLDLEN